MEPTQQLGKAVLVLGLVLVAVGAALYWGKGLGPLGKLPGDIRIERPDFKFYFPIVTCLVLSAVLSAILYLLSKFR